jgi:L-cysteine/cystine lyase
MNRSDLPSLRGVAYLNAGTTGPLPRPAADAMQSELERTAAEPRITRPTFERLMETRERARAAAARVCGGAPDEIALTTGTSLGCALVVAGLAWREGDDIVTTTEEHPGLLGPLQMAARRHGVRVRAVEADALTDAIGERTRLVAVSHVLWTTGRVLALAELAAAAHERGAALLVDGAQSAGAIPLDVRVTGADYYAFSGQKWLLGPAGSGALWVHPDRRDDLAPAVPNYLSFEEGDVARLRPDGRRFDPGMIDTVTLVGFAAAVEWVEAQPGGRAAWVERAQANAARAAARLDGVAGARVVRVPGARSTLLALALPDGGDAAAVVEALAQRRVLVRTIPGTAYVRVSVGAWTSEDEIEALADALDEVLGATAGGRTSAG